MIQQRAWTQRELPASYFVRDVVLRLVGVFAPVLRRFGIDVSSFRVLLHVALTVDARGGGGEDGSSAGPRRFSGVILIMVMTLFFGTILGVVGALALPVHRAAGLLATSQLTIGCMMTASAFSALLFDRATASLVAGRPIDDRTVFVARVVPPALFIALIQGSLALPQCIAIAIRHGAWPSLPLAVAIAVLATVLASALVLAIFVSVMRSVTAERFKAILGRVQIVVSLLFIAGPQLFQFVPWFRDHPPWAMEPGRFAFLLPPAWYAELMAVGTGLERPIDVLSLGLGWLAPFACLWLVIRAATGKFVAAMSAPEAGEVQARRPRPGLLERLAPRFTRSPLERAGYSLCAALQLRDRTAILQIVPGCVVGGVFVLQVGGGIHRDLVAAFPFLPYAIAFGVPQIASAMSRNESYAAAWVAHASPVPNFDSILVGALRATIVRFVFIPSLVVIAVASLTRDVSVVWTAITAGFAATAIVTTVLRSFNHSLPFSEPLRPRLEGGISIVKHILTLMGTMLVLMIHRFSTESVVAHLVFAVIVATIAARGWRAVARMQARGVELDET